MADTTTSAESLEKVTAFIREHTKIEQDIPILEECPICLDNYQHESALRITNVAGCNHIIGISCLTSLLTANPNQDKKCPICRTLWIARPQSGRGQSPRAEETFREAVHRIRRENGRREPRRAIFIDSDSSDDEVTEESFEQFTRDIANIRARARNPTVYKQQRRDEQNARAQIARASMNRSIIQGLESAQNASRDARNALEALLQPTSQDAIRSTTLNETGRRNANPRGSSSEQPLRNLGDESAATTAAQKRRTRDLFGLSRSSSRSTSDEEPLRNLSERTRRTDAQKTELQDWEKRLKGRERSLHERERRLFEREQRVAQRENKAERFADTRRRQLEEMEQVVQRHRNELQSI